MAEKFFPRIERRVHFESLNVKFQLELQVQSALRSFRRNEESEFLDMLLQHFVSSANKNKLEKLTTEGTSFTYIRKSSGPKILPCDTPDETGNKSESWFPIATQCYLVER